MALGNLEYKPCYVACLDILGFTKKVKKEKILGSELKTLVEGMKICGSIKSGGKAICDENGIKRTIEIKSHFFSDSIAFFIRKTEADVPHLFFIIRYLQDQLWKLGFCLRGGISVGEMYWPTDVEDQNILLGPAWIEAHKLEDEIAVYPRIVVSKEVFDNLSGVSAEPFGSENISKLKQCIQKDRDGVYFLDLLNKKTTRNEGEKLTKQDGNFYIEWNPGTSSLWPSVKDSVQKMIDKNIKDNPSGKIRQKYDWLQNYLGSNK